LCTDHSAMTWLLSFRNLEGQTARWVQRLQEYNFTPEHRWDIRHTNAYALSKRSCPEGCCHCQNVERRAGGPRVGMVVATPADGWYQQALWRDQLAECDFGPLIRELDAGRRPQLRDSSNRGPFYKSYWPQWKSLALRDGVLVHHWESADGKRRWLWYSSPKAK
jgi:hypothetical protein